MKIFNYTHDEIKKNINDLVLLRINVPAESYDYETPIFEKVTRKQFKTSNLGQRTVRFDLVGHFEYGSGFFLKKDVHKAVGIFQEIMVTDCKERIELLETKMKRIQALEQS
jgi:hypothetical protein